MSRSLALGVSRAADCDVDAVLVCLADMPFINAGHLRGLLDRFDMSGATIVASAYDGIATPPALFARRHFPTLAALAGDRGARRSEERRVGKECGRPGGSRWLTAHEKKKNIRKTR